LDRRQPLALGCFSGLLRLFGRLPGGLRCLLFLLFVLLVLRSYLSCALECLLRGPQLGCGFFGATPHRFELLFRGKAFPPFLFENFELSLKFFFALLRSVPQALLCVFRCLWKRPAIFEGRPRPPAIARTLAESSQARNTQQTQCSKDQR
ncbi:MAG: hypothetical protein KKB37_15775, partial [Alphaproteobacteria bacterium]|nr:hypothetical protein [Alphaproteobacteria bacterium]